VAAACHQHALAGDRNVAAANGERIAGAERVALDRADDRLEHGDAVLRIALMDLEWHFAIDRTGADVRAGAEVLASACEDGDLGGRVGLEPGPGRAQGVAERAVERVHLFRSIQRDEGDFIPHLIEQHIVRLRRLWLGVALLLRAQHTSHDVSPLIGRAASAPARAGFVIASAGVV